MKKIAFVLLLTVVAGILTVAHAQKFTVGVKGGLSIPNLTSGESDNPLSSGYSSRIGANYGVYGEYHVSPLFSVSVGAEYSSQGGQKNKFQAFSVPANLQSYLPGITYLYANYDSKAKLNYLLVPILARLNIALSKKSPFSVYVAVGPFAGILLNAHQVTSGSDFVYLDAAGTQTLSSTQLYDFDNTENIKSDLHSFNVGVEGLIGISCRITRTSSLFFEGGGNYGFIPIQKDSANGKNRTGAATINLGYTYTF
jgi:hypothetical protein